VGVVAVKMPQVVDEAKDHEPIHKGEESLCGDQLVDGALALTGEREFVGDPFIWDGVDLGINSELVGKS